MECFECGTELRLVDAETQEYYCDNCRLTWMLGNIVDDDIEDDVPEGCAACGGPYPDCTISCPLFDD